MRTLLLKFIPGVVLVTATLLAFAAGNARAENKQPAQRPPVVVAQPTPMQPEADRPAYAPQGDAPARQVIYVVLRERDQITWAPGYYGPQYCDTRPMATDPFTEVRVNPIPWPVNYVAPSLFGPVCERPQVFGRRH